ncbi:hypothetical protein NKH77_22885 [Streptomyces sp. M19]
MIPVTRRTVGGAGTVRVRATRARRAGSSARGPPDRAGRTAAARGHRRRALGAGAVRSGRRRRPAARDRRRERCAEPGPAHLTDAVDRADAANTWRRLGRSRRPPSTGARPARRPAPGRPRGGAGSRRTGGPDTASRRRAPRRSRPPPARPCPRARTPPPGRCPPIRTDPHADRDPPQVRPLSSGCMDMAAI